MNVSRYERGLQKLQEIDGEAGERVLKSLEDIFPDLGRLIIEYSFGDIYTREGLDLKSKEIAVVAALTAMGTAYPQLKVHLNGALYVGCTINEVKEVILQMAAYAGFPCCLNAMTTLKEVLKDRQEHGVRDALGTAPTNIADNATRDEIGAAELSQLDPCQVERLQKAFRDISPELVKFTLEFGYADIYARNNLAKTYRQIATIAALAALGNAQPQLKFHINAGLNIGLTLENIREIMLLMSVYAGFPAAINGTNILKQVVQERQQAE